MTRILVFGDSITYGAWDREGGWVQRLRKHVEGKRRSDSSLVYNLGVSNDSTEDLLERFEPETKQRMKEGEETVIIFSIGSNDSQILRSKGGIRVNQKKFRDNIGKLVELACKFTSNIVFVGPFPVDESRTTPIPWNTDVSYINANIRGNSEVIESVCKEKGILFVEMFERFMKTGCKKLLEDGVHPNSAVHKKIFEAVKDSLEKNGII